MKSKPVCLLAVLLMLVTLTSCRDGTEWLNADSVFPPLSDEQIEGMNAINTGARLQYYDGSLYFRVGSSYNSKSPLDTFWRYNVHTGNLTAVCGDPLCLHKDKSCPFYGMSHRFAIYRDTVFYDRLFLLSWDQRDGEAYVEHASFDMNTHNMKSLFETDGAEYTAYVTELFADQYRFYYSWEKDEETQEYDFSLCRMNLDDGSVTVLREKTSSEEGRVPIPNQDMANIMLFAVDGRIYFNNGGEIYSTDYDLNDKKVIMTGRFATDQIYTDGEFIYWGIPETDNSGVLSLYRAKLDGSEMTALGIRAYRFTLTKKYIYYKNSEAVFLGKEGRSGTSGEEVWRAGSALCRAAHDGSGQEEIYQFQQGDTYYNLVYTCYVGDYVYATYTAYTDVNGNGIIEDEDEYQGDQAATYTLLRINVNTGEMDFIPCGTENRTPS